MPTIFARLAKRPTDSSPVDPPGTQRSWDAMPQNHPTPPNTDPSPHVDRRIHRDLNSLVAEDATHIPNSIDTLSIPTGLAPLHPSPRRYKSNFNVRVLGAVRDERASPGTSVTSAFGLADVSRPNDVSRMLEGTPRRNFSSPGGLGRNLSPKADSLDNIQPEEWPTFGRTRQRPGEFGELVDTRPATPATPISASEGEKSRARHDASTSTLDSHSHSHSRSSSVYAHGYPNSISSPHTFGIPTPTSSDFTPFGTRRQFHSSDTPPPLPPLDHPAFLTCSATRPIDATRTKHAFSASLGRKNKTAQQSKQPRHAASLPSLSGRSGSGAGKVGSPIWSRQRARTQSRTRVIGIFSDHSTPNQSNKGRNNRHGSSSQSRGSNSSRRVSAEFSAMQASSISQGSGLAESWEAQVSREMLRISLGENRECPDSKVVAGATELGSTRGNNVSLLFACHDLPFVFTDFLHISPIPFLILFYFSFCETFLVD